MKITSLEAFKNAAANKFRKYPDRNDQRYQDTRLIPYKEPKFHFSKNAKTKIFTIGSCFAREIEKSLCEFTNIYMPTLKFVAPQNEFDSDAESNHLLNEYTPGTMSQRIIYTCKNKDFGHIGIFKLGKATYYDALLAPFNIHFPVSLERVLQRRKDINELYKDMLDSDLLIVTLGYVESWIYNDNIFLNAIHPKLLKDTTLNLNFVRLDVNSSFNLLKKAFEMLFKHNKNIKIIITLSPVPIQSTFTSHDCVIANSYSKSVLRIVAELLVDEFDNIDYFPSYEIITSMGLAAYIEDNVHVKEEVVSNMCEYFYHTYFVKDAVKKIGTNMSSFFKKFRYSRIGFYGISGRFMTYINQIRQLKNIDIYLYDSDKNKHGNKINGLIIHHPERIIDLTPEIIIITSAFYKEIYEFLKKFKKNNKLAFEIAYLDEFSNITFLDF